MTYFIILLQRRFHLDFILFILLIVNLLKVPYLHRRNRFKLAQVQLNRATELDGFDLDNALFRE